MPEPVPLRYEWVSYAGGNAIVLASVLIVAVAALVFAGTSFERPSASGGQGGRSAAS